MAHPDQVEHGWMHRKLFKLKEDVEGERPDWSAGTLRFDPVPMPAGTIVKVVMVSRFGDCGITTNLDALNGYDARVFPDVLEEIATP